VSIEVAAIVALEEERAAMAAEEPSQPPRDFQAGGIESDQRSEDMAGGEIDGHDEVEFAAVLIATVFGGVDGPGHVGLVPSDGLMSVTLGSDDLLALPADPSAEIAA
jgi:hypothetical protein